MFQVFNNPEHLTQEEVVKRYPHSKYILQDIKDVNSIEGILLAVSTDQDSFHEICMQRDEFADKGLDVSLMGSYGGLKSGVLCEIH